MQWKSWCNLSELLLASCKFSLSLIMSFFSLPEMCLIFKYFRHWIWTPEYKWSEWIQIRKIKWHVDHLAANRITRIIKGWCFFIFLLLLLSYCFGLDVDVGIVFLKKENWKVSLIIYPFCIEDEFPWFAVLAVPKLVRFWSRRETMLLMLLLFIL